MTCSRSFLSRSACGVGGSVIGVRVMRRGLSPPMMAAGSTKSEACVMVALELEVREGCEDDDDEEDN